jgi:hypothetical protein
MEHAGGGVFSRAERLEDVLYGACKPPEPAADVSDEWLFVRDRRPEVVVTVLCMELALVGVVGHWTGSTLVVVAPCWRCDVLAIRILGKV